MKPERKTGPRRPAGIAQRAPGRTVCSYARRFAISSYVSAKPSRVDKLAEGLWPLERSGSGLAVKRLWSPACPFRTLQLFSGKIPYNRTAFAPVNIRGSRSPAPLFQPAAIQRASMAWPFSFRCSPSKRVSSAESSPRNCALSPGEKVLLGHFDRTASSIAAMAAI